MITMHFVNREWADGVIFCIGDSSDLRHFAGLVGAVTSSAGQSEPQQQALNAFWICQSSFMQEPK